MNNTYDWIIKKMDVYPNYNGYTNYVFRIFWKYQSTSTEGIICSLDGYTEYNNLDETYIDYENLTETEVKNWLDISNNLVELRSILDEKTNQILNPPFIELPLPWQVTTTTTTIPEETTTTTTIPEETTTTTTIPEETTTTTTIEEVTTTTTTEII